MRLTRDALESDGEVVLRLRGMELSPTQRRLSAEVRDCLEMGNVCLLRADTGMGKTTILQALQRELNGALIAASPFVNVLKLHAPAAIEESFLDAVEQASEQSDFVLVDDLHLIWRVTQDFAYSRRNLLDVVLSALISNAETAGKRFVFSVANSEEATLLRRRAFVCEMEEFTEEDFASICRFYLGAKSKGIDFARVFRFASGLNGYQLRNACQWLLRKEELIDTEAFFTYLRSRDLSSNVDLEEVEPVQWKDLRGLEDVVEELEAKVALPFENDARALNLDLKPKRGVLLAGPPGTGKTTIGRALAHRLQGKFFLIDGTVNAASGDFYEQVETVFEAAKKNAPSVIFIDDADVIFEAGNHGLARYLLTMMDGLESARAGQVCVMITAMDTSSLPPALLRSGRVELWLRTRYPDDAAREAILREKLSALPSPVCEADVKLLAQKSRGLSGADLKAVIEEGKLLYAHAVVNGRETEPIESFFLRAIASNFANRRNYGKKIPGPFGSGRYGFSTE